MRKISDKHRQWLMKELPLLESAGVLSSDTTDGIRTYYDTNTRSGMHWAVVAFAIMGSLLIGAGIILLFAHNWEDLTRPTRAILSFCPLAIGVALSVLALARNGSIALREASGIFHTLAIGATLSLIGQTYHLPGNMPGFLLSWSLLAMPLMYLLHSTGVYLIYLALICGWSGVAQNTYGHAAGFWPLLLPPVAHLVRLVRNERYAVESSISFAGLIIALWIALGIVFEHTVPGLWMITYSSLLAGIGLIGVRLYGDRQGWHNIPKTFSTIGIVALSYMLTWEDMWHDVGWGYTHSGWSYQSWGAWMDGGITLLCAVGWIVIALKTVRRDSIETVTMGIFPLVTGLCFATGSLMDDANLFNALIFNAFMLFLGIMYIVLGCRKNQLRQLNGGMGILALLLVTRFFDAEYGYLARGIVFIILGTIFLTVNLVMVRRRNRKEVTA